MNDDTIRVFMPDTPRTRWSFAGLAVLGVLLFGFATGVLMAPWAPVLGERLEELTCLQLAFTPERAAAVLGSFDEAQREAIANLLVPADLVFAFGYGLLLAGLLGLLTLRLPASWQRAGTWLTWAPLVASVFDCFEDAFLQSITLAADPAATGMLPLWAGLSASVKYLLLSVVTPAYAVAGSAKGLGVDRRPGALVTYLLVSLLALSMLARPLQQIPLCF